MAEYAEKALLHKESREWGMQIRTAHLDYSLCRHIFEMRPGELFHTPPEPFNESRDSLNGSLVKDIEL